MDLGHFTGVLPRSLWSAVAQLPLSNLRNVMVRSGLLPTPLKSDSCAIALQKNVIASRDRTKKVERAVVRWLTIAHVGGLKGNSVIRRRYLQSVPAMKQQQTCQRCGDQRQSVWLRHGRCCKRDAHNAETMLERHRGSPRASREQVGVRI